MKEVGLLKEKLTHLLPLHQARVTFIAQFILALLDAQTTNLMKVAQKFKGKAKIDSHYKRIQRFLRSFPLDFSLFARLLPLLMPFDQKWVLCLDRTNWKLGKLNINLMVLGVAHKGVCIPLIWSFLDKQGCSNTHERIFLLQRFLHLFGLHRIDFVTADREFIGKDWIQYLMKSHIPFRIRIRKNTIIQSSRSHQEMEISQLFRGNRLGQCVVLNKKKKVWGLSLHVIGLRTQNDYVILITEHSPHCAMADYKRRWEIETLFGCLKSRGFDFEETHLTESERIEKLLALLSFTLCWCLLYGEYNGPRKLDQW
jgi:IS4 transposase